jgi:predicted TIM-barrel fold metal-dependent hydrolase
MQIYPPGLSSMEVSPERMLGEMDIAGVDVCVLQSDHVYGELNEFYGKVSRKYPNKFAPLAQIKEWNADQKDELQNLEKAVCEEGCIGLSFSVEGFALNGYKDQIDDRKFDSLWNLVEELDIPVWWYLDARKRDRATAFMERLEELGRWTETHPDVPNLLTHGLVPATLIHNMGIPDALTNLLKKPQTYAEFQNPAKWPEYPYPEGQDLIKRMCEEVGVESFTWGSDMPFSAGYWCTYKQSVDHIDIHCDFLSEKERNLILGGNAARILNIDITE